MSNASHPSAPGIGEMPELVPVARAEVRFGKARRRRYDSYVKDAMVFVLAGGLSSRMGREKAFLELDGRTLLSRTMQVAQAVSDQVMIVGSREKFSRFGPVVVDVYRERGPLGGVHAALAGNAAEWNLMLAVDLPRLQPELLQFIASQARQSGAMVTVPRAGGRFQPLCAVYRKAFLPFAEAALREGKNKIDALFPEVDTRVIEEPELVSAGFAAGMFMNVNTPEEYKAALQEQKSQGR